MSAAAGVAMFLVLVLFASHVLVGLHARSVVTAAAYDAARRVASVGADPGAVGPAEAAARAVIGAYADDATFDWDLAGDDVVLRVRIERAVVAPVFAHGPLGAIDRVVHARVECVREEGSGACAS